MGKAILIASITLAMAASAGAKPGQGNPHQQNQGASVGYGVGGCPPGLAKKNPACMPPGRYKKMFEVGQRVPYNFQGLTGYEGLPYNVRQQYGPQLDPRSRYIYDQGYIYRVDPTTMVVSQILQSILR